MYLQLSKTGCLKNCKTRNFTPFKLRWINEEITQEVQHGERKLNQWNANTSKNNRGRQFNNPNRTVADI